MNTFKRTVLIVSFFLFQVSICASAKAQEVDTLKNDFKHWNRFSVSLGGFIANYNSGITFASKQLGIILEASLI